ncbi:MAG: hypothetical protein JW719_11040 [Pirellulales bacterium]|nr:hypothetical protein [Pirellulales bacterium]
MDPLKELRDQLMHRVRAMTPGSRIAAGLLALVVAVSLGYLCMESSNRAADQAPGTGPLAATNGGNTAKGPGDPIEEAISRDKPWLFPRTSEAIYKNAEEKKLETEIADLFPDVAEAKVTLNFRAEQRHGRPRNLPIASVGVKMKPGASLNRDLGVMICNYVAQAAGRDPAHVRLFDPSHGTSYQGSREGDPSQAGLKPVRPLETAAITPSATTISNQPRQLPAVVHDRAGTEEETGTPANYARIADEPPPRNLPPRTTAKPVETSPESPWFEVRENPLGIIVLGAAALGMAGWFAWWRRRRARWQAVHSRSSKAASERTDVFSATIGRRDDAGGIALDGQLARRLIERHQTRKDTVDAAPFGLLRKTDSRRIARILDGESSQTIALVLSHLSSRQAGEVLARFAPEVQAEVVRRLVDLEQTEPEVLAEIERGLASRLAEQVPMQSRRVAGVKAAGGILAAAGEPIGRRIFGALAARDESLAAELAPYVQHETETLSLDDLARLEPAILADLCHAAGDDLFALALVGAPANVADRLLAGLPGERAEAIRRALDRPQPIRLSEVDTAREELIGLVESYAVAAHGT